MRILCAEDHPWVGEMLLWMFTRAGHSVAHAIDGQAAWELLLPDFEAFDVLITDHQMPRVDGLTLVKRVRGTPFRGRIVVHATSLRECDARSYRALDVDLIL